MGKATGISSQFRGKVGNVIGYLTKNRAGRYEQSVKAYQPVVANPQSFAQALSRVPVGPVQRICSALLTIIQRGFEGVSYGDASKSEFLSYNLRYFRGPFLEKSYPYIVPGPVLLSRGCLKAIGITSMTAHRADTNVVIDDEAATIDTIAELSQLVLLDNQYLMRGEQWTLVWVVKLGDQFAYNYLSFFLDPNSQLPIPDGITARISDHRTLTFGFGGALDEQPLAACAIIRSQPFGTTSFRRSTTFLTCSADINLYNTEDDVRRAVASYRDGDTPEDWEDDPTPEYQKIAYLCMVEVVADMCTNWQAAWAGKYHCLGYMTKGGTAGIFFTMDSQERVLALCNNKGESLVINDDPYTVIKYNSSYINAREYSTAYGTIDEV